MNISKKVAMGVVAGVGIVTLLGLVFKCVHRKKTSNCAGCCLDDYLDNDDLDIVNDVTEK